ncbi:DUF2508 family protein [Brevibacillus borstelensis]|uniref:DUF2508 family protein n=1 Tax=Brevibacillus borstelensis TaxID=45462 RepID=UPI0030C33917
MTWRKRGIEEAVNRARLDWQHARHLMEICEPDKGLEDAIYYLQLTEKRYMYLLSHAKREQEYLQA